MRFSRVKIAVLAGAMALWCLMGSAHAQPYQNASVGPNGSAVGAVQSSMSPNATWDTNATLFFQTLQWYSNYPGPDGPTLACVVTGIYMESFYGPSYGFVVTYVGPKQLGTTDLPAGAGTVIPWTTPAPYPPVIYSPPNPCPPSQYNWLENIIQQHIWENITPNGWD